MNKQIVSGILSGVVVILVLIIVIITTSKRHAAEEVFTNLPATQNINEQTSSSNEPVTLLFGGDVMLGRTVQVQQEAEGDYTAVWKNIAGLTSRADFAVINLESPFSPEPPYPTEGFVLTARPDNILGLDLAGIDGVTVANNHFNNAGAAGATFTLDLLQQNGFLTFGAGKNLLEAYGPTIINFDDVLVGFVTQNYPVGFAAGESTVGTAEYNLTLLARAIQDAKLEADLVVAQFHGGDEYTTKPNEQQIAFAHAAIDAGADLVIGHHPHWIQDVEVYKDKYIFYSLGNLIFDQNWSTKTSEGMLVQVTISDRTIESFDLIPVVIEDNFQPRIAQYDEYEAIFADIVLPSTLTTSTAGWQLVP